MPRKWYLESPIDDTPDAPKKKYRVTGVAPLELDGVTVEVGDEFEAALKPHFEAQMLSGGHLTVEGEEPMRMTTPFVPRTSPHVTILNRREGE